MRMIFNNFEVFLQLFLARNMTVPSASRPKNRIRSVRKATLRYNGLKKVINARRILPLLW